MENYVSLTIEEFDRLRSFEKTMNDKPPYVLLMDGRDGRMYIRNLEEKEAIKIIIEQLKEETREKYKWLDKFKNICVFINECKKGLKKVNDIEVPVNPSIL